MTAWEAVEPFIIDGKWRAAVRYQTEQHACHLRRTGGTWYAGTHRDAAAALACAERAARQRNKAEQ